MRRVIAGFVGLVLLMVAGGRSGLAGNEKGPLVSLVEAERAFAQRATVVTTREAFAENLGPDAVVFRPMAVNHHFWAKDNPEWGTKGLLVWDPAFARAAASGDFGYTTGPAEFRTTRDSKSATVWWGYFVSVWTREGGGPWRVAIDTGTTVPKPEGASARFEPNLSMERPPSPESPGGKKPGLDALLKAESAFAGVASQKGVPAAYRETLAESGRIHRDDHAPAIGQAAGVAVLDAQRTSVDWSVVGTDVARSLDLGYAYGTGEARHIDGSIAKFAFLRIWERDFVKGGWKIVLDVETALPVAK